MILGKGIKPIIIYGVSVPMVFYFTIIMIAADAVAEWSVSWTPEGTDIPSRGE